MTFIHQTFKGVILSFGYNLPAPSSCLVYKGKETLLNIRNDEEVFID